MDSIYEIQWYTALIPLILVWCISPVLPPGQCSGKATVLTSYRQGNAAERPPCWLHTGRAMQRKGHRVDILPTGQCSGKATVLTSYRQGNAAEKPSCWLHTDRAMQRKGHRVDFIPTGQCSGKANVLTSYWQGNAAERPPCWLPTDRAMQYGWPKWTKSAKGSTYEKFHIRKHTRIKSFVYKMIRVSKVTWKISYVYV